MNKEQDTSDIEKELKQINIDIIFFFLLVVATLISFYVIIEKKKALQNQPSLSKKELNELYNFNKYFIIFIDIYFLLNAYLSYKDLQNQNDTTEKQLNRQKILVIANLLALISALLYIPIRSSSAEVTE